MFNTRMNVTKKLMKQAMYTKSMNLTKKRKKET